MCIFSLLFGDLCFDLGDPTLYVGHAPVLLPLGSLSVVFARLMYYNRSQSEKQSLPHNITSQRRCGWCSAA
jgi:uncharacterized membrane protein